MFCSRHETLSSAQVIPKICPNMQSFQVNKCKLCNQLTDWMTTPCQLFMTAYWIYLQLPSVSESHLLHPQPEDVPCHGDRDPLITQHVSMSSGYIIWGENSKCSILNTDLKLVSHCDVTCCVHMCWWVTVTSLAVYMCVCVCVCVCVRERERERERERDSDHDISATDQLVDLCSDSFPAFLVLKPAVVEWTGNERAS